MSFSVEALVEQHRDSPGMILTVLESIQDHYGYLPKDVLENFSRQIQIPLSQLFSQATFYSAFSLKPRGRHTVYVCSGTACHVRGASRIVDKLSEALDIAPGETTEDGEFSLETVRCIGCCSLAPVIRVDQDIYGHNSMAKAAKILTEHKENK
jgi:NADH:ubiquinone oxidoreductase subunit E